jgi:putative transposase
VYYEVSGRSIARPITLPLKRGFNKKGENMTRSRLFYHIVWGTKSRDPLISPDIESELYGYIRSKAIGLGGYVYALNGTEDHVHLLAHIPRTLPVAQFVGKVKGFSSAQTNKMNQSNKKFYWQSEYSIFTVSEFVIPKLRKYIDCQKQHHESSSVLVWFEPSIT